MKNPNAAGRKSRAPIELLRTKLWFAMLEHRIIRSRGTPNKSCIPGLADQFEISEKAWYKYARGDISPNHQSLNLVEQQYRGSRRIYDCGIANLFSLLDARHIQQATALLQEAMRQQSYLIPCFRNGGDTLAGWLENVTSYLCQRARDAEDGALWAPLAMSAALICDRYLGNNKPLIEIAGRTIKQYCELLPRLSPGDFIASIPEVKRALDVAVIQSRIAAGEFDRGAPWANRKLPLHHEPIIAYVKMLSARSVSDTVVSIDDLLAGLVEAMTESDQILARSEGNASASYAL
jgi:hypothetical protein